VSSTDERSELLEAIWADQLDQWEDPKVQAMGAVISARVADELGQAVRLLARHGIEAAPVGEPVQHRQRHAGALRLSALGGRATNAGGGIGIEAANVLTELGYRPWDPIQGPAERIHRVFRSNLTLAKTTDVTLVLDLRWDGPTGLAGKWPTALIPNANDYDLVALPAAAWPAYLLVRPVRLVLERFGIRRRSAHQLGPFLGTPLGLIGPLLQLAEVAPHDVVVDLGCGNGRVVNEAVALTGCRGIGVEANPGLAAEARRLAGDRVEIIEADATAGGPFIDRGSVFFVFVPADAAVKLISDLLVRATPGSRIVAHEQHRFEDAPAGATIQPVMVDDAVTVGYCWTV